MKRLTQCRLITTVVLLTMSVARPHEVLAQQQLRRLPATHIAVDEGILTAFVDEPCRNFEAARDVFIGAYARFLRAYHFGFLGQEEFARQSGRSDRRRTRKQIR